MFRIVAKTWNDDVVDSGWALGHDTFQDPELSYRVHLDFDTCSSVLGDDDVVCEDYQCSDSDLQGACGGECTVTMKELADAFRTLLDEEEAKEGYRDSDYYEDRDLEGWVCDEECEHGLDELNSNTIFQLLLQQAIFGKIEF